jgi:hypothetical protein
LQRQRTAPLLQLIQIARTRQCTNQLDKIFALRCLASEDDSLKISPDYSLSVMTVIENLFHWTVAQTCSLDVICCTARCRSFPSWLPNLLTELRQHRFAFDLPVVSPIQVRPFAADSGSNRSGIYHHDRDVPQSIHVRGYCVDTVPAASYHNDLEWLGGIFANKHGRKFGALRRCYQRVVDSI